MKIIKLLYSGTNTARASADIRMISTGLIVERLVSPQKSSPLIQPFIKSDIRVYHSVNHSRELDNTLKQVHSLWIALVPRFRISLNLLLKL